MLAYLRILCYKLPTSLYTSELSCTDDFNASDTIPRATHVPVGEDQQQHIELTRDLADIFNRSLRGSSPIFPLPIYVNSKYPRLCTYIY